jgi:hypothetical protein
MDQKAFTGGVAPGDGVRFLFADWIGRAGDG